MKKFGDLLFGLASGESEALLHPDLIQRGFFERDNTIENLINGDKYILLGYKGSGKSIIGEKILSLSTQCNNSFFVNKYSLGDFPFSQFGKILPGVADESNKYPTTWSWILHLLLINQLKAHNLLNGAPEKYTHILNALEANGVLPIDDTNGLKQVVSKSSKHGFHINLKILQYDYEHTKQADCGDCKHQKKSEDISSCIEEIQRLILTIKPSSKHIIIIDGIDDILSMKKIQYQALSALFFAVSNINFFFKKENINCKIIILCRTDIFEKIELPNKNKQRADFSITINWYHDSRNPSESMLLSLANCRAKLSDPNCQNVIADFFPKMIKSKESFIYLLEYTRHTPRDFIQLLVHIQNFSRAETLSTNDILSGVKEYSNDYFLPEIKDEMVGYGSADDFNKFLEILSSFREREIATKQILVDDDLPIETKKTFLRALFECSAIGNKSFNRITEENIYHFRFRNRNYAYCLSDTIVLHNALWTALR